ncbi:MAG: hypothetical protein IKH88_08320 [Prevotella sp.]|nr:hypothetical protein [Prevotella sp.]
MEELEKAYQALEVLENLGLPVSNMQMLAIARMEEDYLEKKVYPVLMDDLRNLTDGLSADFVLDLSYERGKGLRFAIPDTLLRNKPMNTEVATVTARSKQKMGVIKVTFPDGKVICHQTVADTLVDVVKKIGPKEVQSVGIRMNGQNLVSSKLFDRFEYRRAQKPVGYGLYVNTLSPTGLKYDQLQRINNLLHLGLKIERLG